MKSIKEKAEEYSFINEIIDSDGKVLYTDYSLPERNAFEAGANYVLEIIEQSLTPQKCLTDIGINISPKALIKTALQTIEQLKK